MGATENVAKLKDAYRRWHETKGGSDQVWLDLMADDIKIRSIAAGAAPLEFTKKMSAKSQMQEYFAGLRRDWEMKYYTTDFFIAEGDRVAVQCMISFMFKSTGKVMVTPKADFWTFKDGKAIAFYEYYDTAALIEATKP